MANRYLDTHSPIDFVFAKRIVLCYYLQMKSENLTLGHYTDSLQSEGQYWFLRSKAIEALKLSDTAFKFAANRLMKKGKIKRILADF